SISALIVWVYYGFAEYSLKEMPIFLAILVLARWLQLTWTCRAFSWAGERILPIMHASFGQMSGIFVVTGGILAGFANAFLALEIGFEDMDHFSVVLGSLRLLLLGDGDGIDMVLGLDGAPQEGSPVTFVFLVIAVVVFCICVLNLFIAVHGEAYEKAHEKAHISFVQERATICLQCLLRPSWPPACFKYKFPYRKGAYLVLMVLVLPCWVMMLRVPALHPGLPSALLFVALAFGDSILVQKKWDKECEDQYYLWICHRADYDASSIWPADDGPEADSSELDGRHAGIKRDNFLRFERMAAEIEQMRRYVVDKTQGLDSGMEAVEKRVARVENALGSLVGALQK
ncbi:unnamed protein product, partial [Polarella glacialis]